MKTQSQLSLKLIYVLILGLIFLIRPDYSFSQVINQIKMESQSTLITGKNQSDIIGNSESDLNPFLQFKNFNAFYWQNLKASEGNEFLNIKKGNAQQSVIPELSHFTIVRLFGTGSLEAIQAYDQEQRTQMAIKLGKKKIPEIINKLKKEGLIAEAIRLAKVFKISPVHILGPIIGENTFNGFIDRTIQNYFSVLFSESNIQEMKQRMQEIINNKNAQNCLQADISNYWKWRCIVFYSNLTSNNSNRDMISFFYSLNRAKTGSFGIAQVQPFLLWSVSDLVSAKMKVSSYPVDDINTAMNIVYDNKKMLSYIAAMAVNSIAVYKYVAHVDISNNPGLTTTLYNLGDEYQRAYSLKLSIEKGITNQPNVNYMGWFINYFEDDIQKMILN